MENDTDNQKAWIETAINTDNYSEARKELEKKIDQEGYVEVALNAKESLHAIMAVNRIKNGNVDLLAIVAKNAKDCEVAMEAVRRINKIYHEILSDIAQNASYEEVRNSAKSKIANQNPLFKDKRTNTSRANQVSSKKEMIHKSDENNGSIQKQKDKKEQVKSDFYYLKGLVSDAKYAWTESVAMEALEQIGPDNQDAFVDIAKNSLFPNVAVASVGGIDSDNLDAFVDIVKRTRFESVAMEALEQIGPDNQDVFVDIVKRTRFESVAMKALKKISLDNQDVFVNIARNVRFPMLLLILLRGLGLNLLL